MDEGEESNEGQGWTPAWPHQDEEADETLVPEEGRPSSSWVSASPRQQYSSRPRKFLIGTDRDGGEEEEEESEDSESEDEATDSEQRGRRGTLGQLLDDGAEVSELEVSLTDEVDGTVPEAMEPLSDAPKEQLED